MMRTSGFSRPLRPSALVMLGVGVMLVVAVAPLRARQASAVPGPPQQVSFAVNGNAVSLLWGLPSTGGLPTHFIIQAGSGPGAIDYGVFNVGAVTSVAASVPTGRYYVRLIAVNAAGAGPPSPDVVIDVGVTPPPVATLRCVAFGPYVAGYSPMGGPHPPPAVIDALVARVATETDANCLMTYGVLNGLDYTFEAARRRGLRVIAILWLEGNAAVDEASISLGILRARQYPDTIVRIACGSEMRLRHGAAVAEQVVGHCFSRLRAGGVVQPIGTNDTWWDACHEQWPCRTWPAVMGLDWIGVNVFAWWENRFSGIFPCITAADAPSFHIARLQDVRAAYPGKEIILTEFGWPAGPDGHREINQRTGALGCGVASLANQQFVVNRTAAAMRQMNLPYVVFSAFREPWKINEGPVGPFWGILADGPAQAAGSRYQGSDAARQTSGGHINQIATSQRPRPRKARDQ
jgi:exo-beta-1,3-glucanase (GH17 family)